ncbi:MAG: DNA-binding protein Alba [Candidatus Hodarchaeales archaeon]|jgi:DNA-binding protein
MTETDKDPTTIFIGSKPVYSYIMACMTQLSEEKEEENPRIILKARGRAITRAVDVAEVLSRKFMEGKVKIEDIQTSTEQLETRDGRMSNVSAIEITIVKL